MLLFLDRSNAKAGQPRYFWEGKFFTALIDASPQCLVEVQRVAAMDEFVLRHYTIKVNSAVDRAFTKNYKNPYLDALISKELVK